MIKNKDRSGWFGASDTATIMGNWETDTFAKWWLTKLKLFKNNFSNVAMLCGTYKEHQIGKIIEKIENKKLLFDRQIKIRKWLLRVNLDCETKAYPIEIKTYISQNKEFTVPKNYYWQVQVQLLASKRQNAKLYAYKLCEEDYRNFFLDIDIDRVKCFNIIRDDKFLEDYIIRLKYLCKCLKKGRFPTLKGLNCGNN